MTNADLERSAVSAAYELNFVEVRSPPRPSEHGPGVEVLRDEVGDVFALVWGSAGVRFVHLPGVATFGWSQDHEQVTAACAPNIPRVAVTAAFRKFVVPLHHYFAGYEVLHASAVLSAAGVVGLCGDAETGKSTLAYGLGIRGFPPWADDALGIDVSRGRPVALALPFESQLRPAARKFFDGLTSSAAHEEAEAPLAAVAVVVRTTAYEEVARVERLAGGRAFRDVVRHAYRIGLATDHDRRRSLVESYMQIVASVPVFEIRFRPGFDRLPRVLDIIAASLTAELGAA